MSAPIITIMDGLVASAPSTLVFPVTAMSKRRWLIETDAGPVVQLECLDSPNRALIYATAARDGGRGPCAPPSRPCCWLRIPSPSIWVRMESVRVRQR